MELQFFLSAVLLLIVSTSLAWKHLKSRKLPRSPPGLPILGHLHHIGAIPHQSLQTLAERYGPIIFLKLGRVPSIVISNATLAKEVLKTQDATFAARPYLVVGEFVYKFKDLLSVPCNEHWRNMRRLCSTELFTARRMDLFQWLRMEELSSMLDAMLNAHESGSPVKIRDLLTTFNFNVMTGTLMSKRFLKYKKEDTLDKEALELIDVLHELTSEIVAFHISEFFPFLRCIDRSVPRVKRLHSKLANFLNKVIEERKAYQGTDHIRNNDFMSVLMESFEKETVQAMIMELIQGGTDTSASVMEFSIAELLRYPNVMKKAQEEIEAVVGTSRMVNESDLQRLGYVQAVVKEVFRLHPPATLLPHFSTEACKLSGYEIPKGATTFINVYAIGRDPASWERPTEFMPERFLGKSTDLKGQDFELLPFGGGRRICPGMVLALRVVHLVVSNLIHGFNWEYVPGRETRSFEELHRSVTWLKTPIEAVATPRLVKEAYT